MDVILVTGHLGYIGSHLCRRLDQIEGCDRKRGQDFSEIRGREFDTVFHLAARVSVTESFKYPNRYFQNNAYKLAKFLFNNKIKRLIFASTGGALYGNMRLAKEHQARFDLCKSPYAQSKFIAEEIIRAAIPNHVILRLANVYGGDHSTRGEANVHARFETDNPIQVYGGEQTRDFIHIDQVIESLLIASQSSVTGTFNIGSASETNITDLAQHYSKQRNVPIEFQLAREGEVDFISLDTASSVQAGLTKARQRISTCPMDTVAVLPQSVSHF